MAVRFEAKIGQIEFKYEGEELFLKTEMPLILDMIIETAKGLPAAVSGKGSAGGHHVSSNSSFEHTTNTIASNMGAKTGPDLALSAALHLGLVRGQDKFTRKELLTEMQGATTFYNQNYSGNLSKILGNLTRGKRLNLVGNGTYALAKAVRDEYEEKLAQIG